jgi:hypothetical protein
MNVSRNSALHLYPVRRSFLGSRDFKAEEILSCVKTIAVSTVLTFDVWKVSCYLKESNCIAYVREVEVSLKGTRSVIQDQKNKVVIFMKGRSIKQDSRNEYRHREKLGDSKTTKSAVAMVIKCNVRHEYKHESSVPRCQKEPKSNLVLFLFSDTQKDAL